MTKKRKVYEITFKISTMLPPDDFPKEMCDNINHYFSGMAITDASYDVKKVKDKRDLPEPSYICKHCKYCVNKECWYDDCYYGECDGDYDVCFTPENTYNKEEIIDEYWRRIAIEQEKER